jgi:hypothetical protein
MLTAVVWAVTEPWPFLARNFQLVVAEAVSSAADLRQAYQSGLLDAVKPLACCYICIEDCMESQLAGPADANASVADAASGSLSYLDTYEAFCRRIMASGLYDAACFATCTRADEGLRVSYPASDLSFATLASNIAERASGLLN